MKNRPYLLIIMVAYLATSPLLQAQTPTTALEQGIRAEQLGLTLKARDHFLRAIEEEPEDFRPLMQLGLLYEKNYFNLEALNYFHQALQLNDTSASLYNHIVFNHIEIDDYYGTVSGLLTDSAQLLSYAERAIELQDNSADAMIAMALIHSKNGNHTNAMTWCKKAIATDPNNPRAYNAQGIICYRRGNDADALANYRKALAKDQTNIDAYYNIGVLFVTKKNYESAISYLRKGLQSNNASLEQPKTNALAQSSDLASTKLHNNRFVKLYYMLGVAYRGKGDSDRAKLCFETIIGTDSLNTDAYNQLGALCNDKGNYDQAIAYHTKATQINPKNAESYKCLGRTNSDRGNYPAALRNYQRALQLNSNDCETYLLMAQLYARQNNATREASSYKKAAKLGCLDAQRWMIDHGKSW